MLNAEYDNRIVIAYCSEILRRDVTVFGLRQTHFQTNDVLLLYGVTTLQNYLANLIKVKDTNP